MIHRRLAVVATVALVAGGLSACAQPHASASGAASHSTTSTPKPSVTSPAIPAPVLPIGCADLTPLTTLQADISPAVTVRRDEHSEPVGWHALVERQAGVLDCAWGTDDRTDATFDDGLSLTVVADAAADFDAFSRTSAFQAELAVTVGDRSGIACADGAPVCSGDVLAGSSWLRFTYSAKTRGGDLANDVIAVIGGAAARVKAAGPAKAAWIPPSGAFAAPDCTPELGRRLTGLAVQVMQPELETGSGGQDALAARRAHQAECTWTTGAPGVSGDTYTMTVLTGGRWGFDALRTNGIGYYGGDAATRAPLAGSDGTLSSCGQACSAVVSYRGSLVLFEASVGSTAADDGEKAAVDEMASRLVASVGTAS